jgi:hypothetical protein
MTETSALTVLVVLGLSLMPVVGCARSRSGAPAAPSGDLAVTVRSPSGASATVRLVLRAGYSGLRRPLDGLKAGEAGSGYLLAHARDRAHGVDLSTAKLATDVALLDDAGRVVKLKANVAAGERTRVDRIPDLYRSAVVLPAGSAARLGLAPGATVTFALPEGAASEASLLPVTLRPPGRPEVIVAAELAMDEEEITLGLMYRRELPALGGMLFRFETARVLGFWMENTRVPLDMIFLDEDRRVTGVVREARPYDRTVVGVGRIPNRYVLEVRAGFARQHGIVAGTQALFAIPRD